MLNRTEISKKLISLRGKRSRQEVARACGISTSAVTMYETGHRIPRDEIKVVLANYFNTTVESIFFNQ